MGEARRTIIVHAYDDNSEPNDVGFSMSGYGVRNNEIKCAKDKARGGMPKERAHEVVFELADRTDLELRFVDDLANAMWVSDNDTDCPHVAAHQNTVVRATEVSQDGERLTVENFNPVRKRYKFALNFVDKDGTIVSFDPIWENQNGGKNR